jgi:hypothetical protein
VPEKNEGQENQGKGVARTRDISGTGDTSSDNPPEVLSSPSQVESDNPTPPATDEVTGPVNLGDAEMHGETTAPAPVAAPAVPQVTPTAPAPSKDQEKPRGLDKILKLTGLKKDEVLSYNPNTLTVVSSAGGKYQMNSKGTQIRHLSGPRPPSVSDAEAQAQAEARREAAENAQADRE